MKSMKVLSSAADSALLQPILEALHKNGLRAENAKTEAGSASAKLEYDVRKDDVVLAALTENFYSDSSLTEKLLALLGTGAEHVLPLHLDDSKIPDELMNALYSRNIISAAERDPGLIAERIIAALPKKKSRLPLILSVAAVLLVAVIGLFLWRGSRGVELGTASDSSEISILSAFGLTEEDLAEIELVYITGDRVRFYRSEELQKLPQDEQPDWDDLATRNWENGGAHYYSREDGQEVFMARYEDLSFLSLMPKLRSVRLCNIEAEILPDLRESAYLENLTLGDCNITDLEWLRGAGFYHIDIMNSTGSIRDFSPLTDCKNLHSLHIDLVNCREADLSQLAPPELDRFWLINAQDVPGMLDLSSLSACRKLKEVQLESAPVSDISFLRGAESLENLRLEELESLQSISVLGDMKKLKDLVITDCVSLQDYRPVGDCDALEHVLLNPGWNRETLTDVSFLSGLNRLTNIQLYNMQLGDLDFLNEIGRSHGVNNFDISGTVGDWSGLAGVRIWHRLCLDPDPGNVTLEELLPYLEGASIQNLALRRFSGVDISSLPRVTEGLELDRCGVTDLTSMPEDWKASYLNLNKCQTLRSLEGLQNQSYLGNSGRGSLTLYQCPRLTDWSALGGMNLGELKIFGGYSLPDFSTFRTGQLYMDSVEDVTDLSFLDGMDSAQRCSFTLVGMNELNNLQPLQRFHGDYLAVSPQLAEQAQDLVHSGNFREFRVEYPEGGWDQDDAEFSLLSLDELDTLPPALLRRITRVCIAGDKVFDRDRYDVEDDWENQDRNGRPGARLVDRQTGESIPVSLGSIRDLSVLSSLTGLRDLRLYAQPIESLDGIQIFTNLEQVTAAFCSELKDASAAFALQDLWEVNLRATSVESIQGVQNLTQLRMLDLFCTDVYDLSPLAGCDFSAAAEQGGFTLNLEGSDGREYENLSALASVPRFDNLCLNNIEASQWLAYVEGAEIRCFSAVGAFDDDSIAAFVRSHPGVEELHIPWNEEIHDLSMLAGLPNLNYVKVSRNMENAIRSLDGLNTGFRLEIEG